MESTYSSNTEGARIKVGWKRDEVSRLVDEFGQVKHRCSQRQFARENGVPRTTLQHWLARKDAIDQSPALTAFLESPDGLAFLHRLITAAHLEFTKNGAASIHNVSNFLKMIGLSSFVASSYSAQRRIAASMNETIFAFEKKEHQRLSCKMPPKIISICEDETFHPETCLVAIEPFPNFILVEKYADDRKTETWDKAVESALKHLPVKIVQVVSDQGRSLICHALKSLKVHHSPDCFHVIYETGKGTSVAMSSKIKKAEAEYDAKERLAIEAVERKEKYDSAGKRPRGRRLDFEKRIHLADSQAQKAEEDLDQLKKDQEALRDAKAQIGQVYHPYDLKSGKRRTAQDISELLEGLFDKIKSATRGLSEKCRNRVSKAQRVVKEMIGTIAFFHAMIDVYIGNMNLSDRDRELMETYLVPGYYLEQAAARQKEISAKTEIAKKAQELLSIMDSLATNVR